MFCVAPLPLTLSIYYSEMSQNDIGGIEKVWTKSRTVKAALSMSTNYKDQQIQAGREMWIQDSLSGMAVEDPRIELDGTMHAMTDIIITDILDVCDEEIYIETAGPRLGKSTLYELAGCMPHNGPFGTPDYYKIVLRRSDDQELD